jgi:hypothetical protein
VNIFHFKTLYQEKYNVEGTKVVQALSNAWRDKRTAFNSTQEGNNSRNGNYMTVENWEIPSPFYDKIIWTA